MAVPIFLLTVYARTLLGPSVGILFIIAILVFGYITRKKGYVEKVKELSPKYYYKYYYSARRVRFIVGGGLLTGFAILTLLRLLLGRPLPSPQGLLLFIILMVLGAYVSDIIGRKLKLY
jgi:MFS family permease